MADQLAIDLAGIEAWGAALNNVRSGMDQRVAPSASGDSLGPDTASATVANALGDFDTAWNTGRQVIDSYMIALSKMCDETASRIRATDRSLALPPQHHRRDDF